MTTLQPAVTGDINDTRTIQLAGIDNLNAVQTIVGHAWRGSSTPVQLDCQVDDAADCTVTLSLGGSDGWLTTATPGQWSVEIQASFTDGTVLTWPADKPMTIKVRAQGDPP